MAGCSIPKSLCLHPESSIDLDKAIVSKCMEFRLKPDDDQKILIWKTFGCNRFVWNHLLEERISYEKTNKGKLLNTTPAHLKKDNGFLKEVDSLSLANVQLDLNQACRKLFPKGKVPKFRAKGKDRRSYTTNSVNGNIGIIQKGDAENYIKLPKLGPVRIILHRSIPDGWVLKHVTVKETASGRFFASLVFDVEEKRKDPLKAFSVIEAFDYSMPELLVSASGVNSISPEEIHWYRNLESRIAREQRKLSRMEYGSSNYWKQRKRIGALHEKASSRRKDFLHKLSRKVADAYDAVIVEDLNLSDMSRMLMFGKSVHDNGFGMFRTMLAYKLKDQGKVLVKVDRFFPSSKRCCGCYHINKELELGERYWRCPVCGAVHYRDKNACYNLLQEGEILLNRWTGGDSALILTPEGVLSAKKTLSAE